MYIKGLAQTQAGTDAHTHIHFLQKNNLTYLYPSILAKGG